MGFHFKPPDDLGQEKVVVTYQYGTRCEQESSGPRADTYIPVSRTPYVLLNFFSLVLL
jgi:hypothetical protein